FVAFASSATNLAPGPNSGKQDIFLRDTCIGAFSPCTPSTVRISEPLVGSPTGSGMSITPRLLVTTSNGTAVDVMFVSSADNLVAGDTNGKFDLFRRKTCLDNGPATTVPCTAPNTLRLMNIGLDGKQPNGDTLPLTRRPGTNFLIVFSSMASN